MASWTDGPEYAPRERPAAFVAPSVAALPDPTPPALASEPAPPAPSFIPPEQPAPDLRELAPSAAPGRNPNLPFEATTTPLTAIEPTAPIRQPDQPFTGPGPELAGYLPVQPAVQPNAVVNPPPFPSAGTPQWFTPYGPPIQPEPARTPFSQILRETTAWVLVPLVLAMFVVPISPVALIVSWLSTVQIRYRRGAVRNAYWIALPMIAVISLGAVLIDDTVAIWDAVGMCSTIAAWILVFVIPALVGAALRNHEPPEQY